MFTCLQSRCAASDLAPAAFYSTARHPTQRERIITLLVNYVYVLLPSVFVVWQLFLPHANEHCSSSEIGVAERVFVCVDLKPLEPLSTFWKTGCHTKSLAQTRFSRVTVKDSVLRWPSLHFIPAAPESSYCPCMSWLYCAPAWLGSYKWRLPVVRDNVPPWWRSALWFTKWARRHIGSHHKQQESADKSLFGTMSRSLQGDSSWMQVAWNDAPKVNLLGEPKRGKRRRRRTVVPCGEFCHH